MMQTAEVRDELDLAVSSDRSREWSVFTKGQVRAGAVVVVCIVMEHATRMRLAENALSEQIGLSRGVAFRGLRGCKIPSVISTVRPR